SGKGPGPPPHAMPNAKDVSPYDAVQSLSAGEHSRERGLPPLVRVPIQPPSGATTSALPSACSSPSRSGLPVSILLNHRPARPFPHRTESSSATLPCDSSTRPHS